MDTVVVIPAFRPGQALVELARRLSAVDEVELAVVDDGSGDDFAPVFEAVRALPRTTVLRHAVNLGKGAALKTALNFVACRGDDLPVIVTADADGQHLVEDILAVARRAGEARASLVLGVRQLDSLGARGSATPFRSRLGNWATRILMRWLIGLRVSDTQTGLRAIPASLLPHLLRLRSNRYEFELDMLMLARGRCVRIEEVPIATVYLEGNLTSHFHPLLDSTRIYLLLFRHALASLLSALVDFAIFALVFVPTGRIGLAQIAARGVSLWINYAAVRAAVFHDRQPHRVTFPPYLLLVALSGLVSYAMILFLAHTQGMSVLLAKPLSETLVFFANFAVQRGYIFRSRADETGA